MPFQAPPAVAGTPAHLLRDCDDRQYHGIAAGNGPPGIPPLVHDTHGYNPSCSSKVNNPGPPWWGHLPGYFAQKLCLGLTGTAIATLAHPVPHRACGYCRENIKYASWMQQAAARMWKRPPGTETKAWKGFWTRLCADCQIAEQILILQRQAPGGGLPATHPTVAMRARMQQYPVNTCTCLKKLQDPDLCVTHAQTKWERMRTQPRPGIPIGRDDLVATRNRNKDWLRSMKADPNNNNLASTAHGLRRSQRSRERRYRACRCGQEVVTQANARIFQCMACEGIIQEANVALPAIPTARQLRNSHTHPGLYVLNRATLATQVR